MILDLIEQSKTYHVELEINGAEIKAIVEVSNSENDNWERTYTLKSISSNADIDEDEVEEYIVRNWKDAEETERITDVSL